MKARPHLTPVIPNGSAIKAGRYLADLTQRELARMSACHVGTLNRIENTEGRVSAHTATLLRILSALYEHGVEIETEGSQTIIRKQHA